MLAVALGAAIGAVLRHLAAQALQRRDGAAFPYGTVLVNVLGSLVLGVIASMHAAGGVSPATMSLLGTGFCGALTTYSTFGYETVRLSERRAYALAAVNVGSSVTLGLASAALGWWLGTML